MAGAEGMGVTWGSFPEAKKRNAFKCSVCTKHAHDKADSSSDKNFWGIYAIEKKTESGKANDCAK